MRNKGAITRFIWLLTMIGLVLVLGESARAADYVETWTPLEYRVAYLSVQDIFPLPPDSTPSSPQSFESSTAFCLGPSKWSVVTDYNGHTINETWTGTDWVDTQDLFGRHRTGRRRDGISIRYAFSNTCANNAGNLMQVDFNYAYQSCYYYCQTRTQTNPSTPVQLHPTGLYGGLLTSFGENNEKWGLWIYKSGVRSFPTRWQINGTID